MNDTTLELQPCQVSRIKDICRSFGNEQGELINVLHKTQRELGYLPAEVQEVIAQELNMPVAKVYGVVTFYSFFTMKPKGKYAISICMGTACYVRGAEKVLDEFRSNLGIEIGETTLDGKFSVDTLRCVGACGLAPVVTVGERTFGRVNPSEIWEILGAFE